MSRFARRWLPLLAVLFGLGAASAARADEGDSRNSPEYKELIRKALQEYQLGNWAEAKVFFTDAHALFPNARTLRGLALTTYALRDYVRAAEYFEQALANPVQPLTPELQSGVREYLQQARRFVARVKLRLEPRSAQLRVDDALVTPDADGMIQLNPGQHELVASAPGYETLSRRWSIEAGARTDLSIELKSQSPSAAVAPSVAAATSTPLPASQPTPAAAKSGKGSGPWILLGVSGALAIGGGVVLAVTASDIHSVEDASKGTSWSQVQSAYERTPAMSALGFSMLGVGVAGVAIALAWQLWPEQESAGAQAALELAPGRIGVHGRF